MIYILTKTEVNHDEIYKTILGYSANWKFLESRLAILNEQNEKYKDAICKLKLFDDSFYEENGSLSYKIETIKEIKDLYINIEYEKVEE